ncbi:MAG: CinA family protein [Succinivibrio sp.]
MKTQLLKEISSLSYELKDVYAVCKDVYATAESLTAGFIGASIVEVSGSSAWFDRGFITYSNEAKMELLGVKDETLRSYGAVSEQTVMQMVSGALQHSSVANVAVAVSGIAGPDGGTDKKPVGTVWMAVMKKGQLPHVHCFHFSGDRETVRLKTTLCALKAIIRLSRNEEELFIES